MKGDTLKLAEMIQAVGQNLNDKIDTQHRELTTQINALAVEFAAHKAKSNEKISSIESQQKSDRFWNRMQTVAVFPITASLHQIAAHFGWIK